jgi:hypothetical protein
LGKAVHRYRKGTVMIPALDFRIFGNGYGFAAPYFDQPFYWLGGEFYTFSAGLGAQLHSVQWTHPKPGERRKICGVEFRPFHSHRRWGRVMITWAARLPSDIAEANDWLRQFQQHLQAPWAPFEYRHAAPIEARSDETAKQGSARRAKAGKAAQTAQPTPGDNHHD